ncbi:hypothetical protein Q9L58_001960 [Maublancomyces gigas]|uniref:Uncharacterized protein n=1 Tax=Discina gigas TaxID=1032678 RepID=A0ABR3GT99_9PEZI
MAEAHFIEIENVIEFYKANEVNIKTLLSLSTDKFRADDHLLSLAILASINRHPGAVPDYALAEALNPEGLEKLIALMKVVMELEKQMVKHVKQLKKRMREYEGTM